MGWGSIGGKVWDKGKDLGGKVWSGGKKIGEKALSKSGLLALGGGAMGMPWLMTDEGKEVGKGLANLVTGGYISQQEALAQAERARKQSKDQYRNEIDRANAAARKLEQEEEERKRLLALQGTQAPQTLSGSYLGVLGSPNVRKSVLG
jgi:hypothetical protein